MMMKLEPGMLIKINQGFILLIKRIGTRAWLTYQLNRANRAPMPFFTYESKNYITRVALNHEKYIIKS